MLDRNGGSWHWVDEDGCSESIVRHVARSMSHLYGESFTGDISGVGRIVVPLLNQAYKIGKKSVSGDQVSLQPGPQEKLTEHQIRWVLTALSRLGSLAHLLNKLYIPVPTELAHINVTLQGMHKNQTSDGKPWVEPEPAIPDGWRRAEPDEWQRMDVKFCSSLSAFEWRLRPAQGIPFDKPIHNVRYIVPIDPPLTDHDACVWPRRLVMVRDIDRHPWIGPYKYLGKTDASYSIDPNNGGCATDWKQARPATPAEIEAASNKS
jgi:hypothetical protein